MFGPFCWQLLALDDDMDKVNLTGFNWILAKLAELSDGPAEGDREMFVWLAKLYGHYVEMMNNDDSFVSKHKLPDVPMGESEEKE